MLNFFMTMQSVISGLSLIDIIRAFGDNTLIYYNNDPQLIETLIKIIHK